MKKVVLALFVIVLLASVFVLAASAEQTNMEVYAPRFSRQPVFDGVISEEEWGERNVRVVTEGAATPDSTAVGYNAALGLRNYYYHPMPGCETICADLAFDLWFRWDERYLYVAAVVEDPDPFSLPEGNEYVWNGDCIQFCIDDGGPNAAMRMDDPSHNFREDAFDGESYAQPWIDPYKIFNGVMGLAKKSELTFWRFTDYKGESISLDDKNTRLGITVDDHDDGTCTITYESAIPWELISTETAPAVGNIYGVSAAVACSDSNIINACLQWGMGVMYVYQQPASTRGGAQALILTNDEAVPENVIPPESVTTAPVTTAPVTTVPEEDPELTDGVYTYSVDDGGATVTGLKVYFKGSIVVPDEYEGYPVVAIGPNAFKNCKGILGVELPASIGQGYIGSGAFYGCESLETVNIPYGIKEIRSGVFYGCSSLKEISIPESVKDIGSEAFYGCRSLVDVMVPDSVGSIGDWAFMGCKAIESITIPDSVTAIGKNVFGACKNLTIRCSEGVTAAKYAEKNGIPYMTADVETSGFAGTVSDTEPVADNIGNKTSGDSVVIVIVAVIICAVVISAAVVCIVVVATRKKKAEPDPGAGYAPDTVNDDGTVKTNFIIPDEDAVKTTLVDSESDDTGDAEQ